MKRLAAIHENICNEITSRQEKIRRVEENLLKRKKPKRRKYFNERKKIRKLTQYLYQDRKTVTPHPLIVIGNSTYSSLMDNCLVLGGMKRTNVNAHNFTDGGMTSFDIKFIGQNISSLFHETLTWCDVDVKNIPCGFLLILCKTSEYCLLNDPCIQFVTIDNAIPKYAILSLIVSNVTLNDTTNDTPIWDNKLNYNILKKHKKSTIQTNKANHHYGSSGLCFSFGIRNSFSSIRTNDISIRRYAGDNFWPMVLYRDYICHCMKTAFSSFDRILRGISQKLHVTNESMKYCCKKTQLSEIMDDAMQFSQEICSILCGNININARTRDLHCERDVSYTTIFVPQQTLENAFIIFQFFINECTSLRLVFPSNSCFTYSAYCLSHRQVYTHGKNCMNISSYSGKRLYCSFRRSLHRINRHGKSKKFNK